MKPVSRPNTDASVPMSMLVVVKSSDQAAMFNRFAPNNVRFLGALDGNMGNRYDLVIVAIPISPSAYRSQSYGESVNDWYRTVIMTAAKPDGKIFLL